MSRLSRRAKAILVGAIGVPCILIVGFAIYLASVAGELPWQEDPTRIPVTPFADIPGFSFPTVVPGARQAATPAPTSPGTPAAFTIDGG
jgi:hypothetical protein